MERLKLEKAVKQETAKMMEECMKMMETSMGKMKEMHEKMHKGEMKVDAAKMKKVLRDVTSVSKGLDEIQMKGP